MTTRLVGLTLVVMLAMAGGNASHAQSEPRRAELGTWGFDLAGVDKKANPGDSFNDYANGIWEAQTQIPADRANFGMFGALRERTQDQLRAIIEDNAKSGAARD